MKRVFKLFVLLFIMTILCGCSKDENELIMVTEAGFAPYEYYDNNEIVGVDIDIGKEIAKELNKNLVVKDVAFDSIINEVKSGKADFGAAGISYNEERAKQVDFSINYTVSKQVVIVRKDSSIKSVKDVNNQKIGIVEDVIEVPQGEILKILKNNQEYALVPYVSEFIVDVDINEKKIIIDPIEGLLWESIS